ncbi:hypothetical protein [Neptunicella marina]|uniref:DUF3887 domain-containing protein n=1 Tax=Neptunicella marina TaxID=2125989 RepID=A0A8J6M2Z5_9ALTE|nr:hypothetical protein [Neptunicella marina]MBC3764946.1 hypothetical protein [Neptunicella marina]
MRKLISFTAASLLLVQSLSVFATKTNESSNPVKMNGFECANEVLDVVGLLGRGDDFPQFLASDIEAELKRQDNNSILGYVKCVGKPELKAATKQSMVNGEYQNIITKFSLTFPLKLKVKNGKKTLFINVSQNYVVNNFDQPDKRTVTQNFIVEQ